MPKELDVPECPPVVHYIWEWFCQLSNEREYTMDGPRGINSTGIRNWAGLRRITLTAFELEAITRLDRIYLSPPPEAPGEPDDD